jgi:uncharacterized protein (DUF488 family)
MLMRRRTLLGLLYLASEPLARTKLVKLAFLLRQEEAAALPAFYDFVPFKFGAFSFVLYRDVAALLNQGLLAEEGQRWSIAAKSRDSVGRSVRDLPRPVLEALERTVARYGAMPVEELLRLTYSRYPEYAARSERTDIPTAAPAARSFPALAVYTCGYQGGSVDAFFGRLLRAGIQAIIDVRFNPVSRNYGFARKSMSAIAADLGMEYSHRPELGIPPERRRNLDEAGARESLLDWYRDEFLPGSAQAVELVADEVKRRPAVLVCMETDARCCHRSRLAEAVGGRTGLPVRHL